MSFITANKDHWGVEPICTVLPFAPSTYYAAISKHLSARETRDEELKTSSASGKSIDGCMARTRCGRS